MRIFDISQEIFGCVVYPGDPAPQREQIRSIEGGGRCNLTAFYMCAHNGTHVDAPRHFIQDGRTVTEVGLEPFVGLAYVAEKNGDVTADDMREIVRRARGLSADCSRRILIKGDATLTEAAAQALAEEGVLLYGNESQTVGAQGATKETHLILLGADMVLLEGIRLGEVSEGMYFLNAAPIHLGGSDGAPCRAILIEGLL